MCGIVGYIGKRDAISVLLDGLRRLEYRGYDSAGVAIYHEGDIVIRRSVGKLSNLVQQLDKQNLTGSPGIGHTRWATHGRPTEANAHPHQDGRVVLVHNGIVENYQELRTKLSAKGHRFKSETDTEVLCHLVADKLKRSGSFLDAMRAALGQVEGSYAIVVMDAEDPSHLYFARHGSPLVLGIGNQEMLIASDIPAVLPYTRSMIMLEDGEYGVLTNARATIYNDRDKVVKRSPVHIDWDPILAEKGGYKHFMLKEIFEQPKVVGDTIAGRVHSKKGVVLSELDAIWGDGKIPFSRVCIVACGTSWHAAGVARYWIESLCRIPVSVDLASEFRYRNPVIGKDTLCVAISQSGETADTLAAAQMAKTTGAKVLAICNVQGSSLTRMADTTLYTRAGPEIGVASTKAFTTQLTVLWLLTLYLAQNLRKLTSAAVLSAVEELKQLPGLIQKVLEKSKLIQDLAAQMAEVSPVLFIGRGTHYPVVLEGALKLKEIAYTHAEGFAGGELKHGPIALVDQGVPVVSLLPLDKTLDKLVSNIQEVMARGATIIAVGHKCPLKDVVFIETPKVSEALSPILYVVPLQLLAYYIADRRGTDVDQPRNLAKSVTVE